MLFIFFASIPFILTFEFIIKPAESSFDEVLGWSIVSVSTGLTLWFSIRVLYPFFKDHFD